MYTPNNASIYLAANAGALAGLGASGKFILDAVSADYLAPALQADAYAQQVDQAFGVGTPTGYEVNAIRDISEAVWETRSPLKAPDSYLPGNYAGLAAAVVALAREGNAQVVAEGIDPNAGGGGGAGVASVTATSPITSTGGVNPVIGFASFVTPQRFGAVGNGVANDGPFLALADAAAVAAGVPLWITGGTFRAVGAITFASNVIIVGGAQLAPTGTLTFSGPPLAPPVAQLWPAATTVLFEGAVYKGGIVPEIWINWWGAKGDNSTDSTTAFQSALLSYQTMLQSTPQFSTGSGLAPELRLAPGAYIVNSQALNTNPILEIENVVGGILRGCGTASTIIETAVANSAMAVIQRTNAQRFRIVDLSIVPSFSGLHLTANVAVGDGLAGKPIPAPTATLYSGQPVTLWQFGQWYEEAVVDAIVDAGHFTIKHPTRFAYLSNNFVFTCVRACVRDFNDVTDPGYSFNSTANTCENYAFGSNGLGSCLYGWAIECQGGTGSPSDVDNESHQSINGVMTNPAIAGMFIGHKNAIQQRLFMSSFSQGGTSFFGIHAPNGGNFDAVQCGFSGNWARIAIGGTNSDACKLTNCHSESASSPIFMSNQWVPQCTRVAADFVQPAVGFSVNVTVDTTANWAANGETAAAGGGGWYTITVVDGTTLSLLNLGAEENYPPGTTIPNGANIGQALKFEVLQCATLDDFSGPARTTITASAAPGQPVVHVASVTGYWPGQKFTLSDQVGGGVSKLTVKSVDPVALTLTMTTNLSTGYTSLSGGIYGYASPSYYSDISGRSNTIQVSTSFMDQGQDQVPGQELHLCDVISRTSQMSIRDTPLGAVGFTLANAFLYMSLGQMTDAAGPVRTFRETLKGDSARVVESGNQISNSGGHYPAGSVKGLTRLFVQIDATMSPYTAELDTTIIVNASAGNVVILLPVIPIWHSITIKQDESTALGANTISITPDASQSLAEPVPNNGTFTGLGVAFVITGDENKGTELTWTNQNSGAGRLLVS